MNISSKALAVAVMCACLVSQGCTTLDVYNSAEVHQKGLPFYTRAPVMIQESAVALPAWDIQLEVVDESDATKTSRFPDSPMNVLAGDRTRSAVRDAQAMLDQWVEQHPNATITQARSEASQVFGTIAMSASEVSARELLGRAELISNTYRVESQLSPSRYFVNARNPLIGTSTADFKLNSDGTIGEASATVTDQTASTLLGLVPVSAYLSKQWGLTAPAKPTATSNKNLTILEFGDTKPKTKPTVFLRLNVAPDRRVYLLREVDPASEPGSATLQNLSIADALDCTDHNRVQLVRIATESQLQAEAAKSVAAPAADATPPNKSPTAKPPQNKKQP